MHADDGARLVAGVAWQPCPAGCLIRVGRDRRRRSGLGGGFLAYDVPRERPLDLGPGPGGAVVGAVEKSGRGDAAPGPRTRSGSSC